MTSRADPDSPPPAPAPEAQFDGSQLVLTRVEAGFTVQGNAVLVSADGSHIPVTVDGTLVLDTADPEDATPIEGVLSFTTEDGRTLRLSITVVATRVSSDDSSSSSSTVRVHVRRRL